MVVNKDGLADLATKFSKGKFVAFLPKSASPLTYRGIKEITTSNAEKYSPKGRPSLFSISLKVLDHVHWIESTKNIDVMFEQVVKTNATDEEEPHEDYRSKGKPHFISTKPLHSEQSDQDHYRNPHNSI